LNQWTSQPRFKYGANLGDFILSCSTLFSGNAYSKVAVFLTGLNMKPPNRTLFYKIHTHYAVGAVDTLWKEVQSEVLEDCKGREVVLLGKCDQYF
jgi:hypothetical protein